MCGVSSVQTLIISVAMFVISMSMVGATIKNKKNAIDNPVVVSGEPEAIITGNKDEIKCLAMNIYFEARGEGKAERVSVAHVTLNRVGDSRFPNTVCEVVHQPNQFSWTLMSKDYRKIKNKRVFEEILLLAEKVYHRKKPDPTNGATHYYSHKHMKNPPKWASKGHNKVKLEAHTYMALNW